MTATASKAELEQSMARATSTGLAFGGKLQKGDYHKKYNDAHVALGSGMSGTVVKVYNHRKIHTPTSQLVQA